MKNKKLYLLWQVAHWEFNRWFKLKEHIITLLVFAVLSVLIFGGKALLDRFSNKEIKIAVINQAKLVLQMNRASKLNLVEIQPAELADGKRSLSENRLDGILVIQDVDHIELTVNKEPVWLPLLQETIAAAQRRAKIEQAAIPAGLLEDLLKPAKIKLTVAEKQKIKSTRGEKVAAGVFIGIMLVGVFFGLAYQFVAITGEKQLRITEVIVSAISPQTWIDGKILGISFLSLAMLLTYSLTTVVFVAVSSLFGSGWSLPLVIRNPFLMLSLAVFSLAGFFFWNTFFSAIAATIHDPNTSARGSLMMVPLLPVLVAFLSIGNPDSLLIKILSLFPLTSTPVISARLVLTDVSIIEMAFSLLLLAVCTWYLRKAAGKIFSLSILMYGKEPSWKEMSRWLHES